MSHHLPIEKFLKHLPYEESREHFKVMLDRIGDLTQEVNYFDELAAKGGDVGFGYMSMLAVLLVHRKDITAEEAELAVAWYGAVASVVRAVQWSIETRKQEGWEPAPENLGVSFCSLHDLGYLLLRMEAGFVGVGDEIVEAISGDCSKCPTRRKRMNIEDEKGEQDEADPQDG